MKVRVAGLSLLTCALGMFGLSAQADQAAEKEIRGVFDKAAQLVNKKDTEGLVKITAQQFPLEDAGDVLHLLDQGRIEGRAVLLPAGARLAGSASAAAAATR